MTTSNTTEIDQLKNKIIALHAQAHQIIMNRQDINEPLTFGEAKRFAEINDSCDELQKKLRLILVVKELPMERVFIKGRFTEQEKKLLDALKGRYPTPTPGKDLVILTGLKRNRVYEHLRTFLVAGLVAYCGRVPGKDGYQLTKPGLDHLAGQNIT
jgi:hypothetical protein